MSYLSFINSLHVPEGASLKVVDKNGIEKTTGSIVDTDEAIVTSGNMIQSKSYLVNFSVKKPSYIESDVYTVNLSLNFISSVPEGISVADFASHLTPAPGATFIIVDLNGNEVTSGVLSINNRVKVTSEDGQNISVYSIGFIVSVERYSLENITAYPNPTSDRLYVKGLPTSGIVSLRDILGREVMMFNSEKTAIEIPMKSLPSGFYILSVQDEIGKTIQLRILKQ